MAEAFRQLTETKAELKRQSSYLTSERSRRLKFERQLQERDVELDELRAEIAEIEKLVSASEKQCASTSKLQKDLEAKSAQYRRAAR